MMTIIAITIVLLYVMFRPYPQRDDKQLLRAFWLIPLAIVWWIHYATQ